MDPITIAQTALKIGMYLFGEAQKRGIIGEPDWAKYMGAGLHVIQTGISITEKMKSGVTDYDALTSEEIEALLLPDDWAANEVRRLADEKAAKDAGQ